MAKIIGNITTTPSAVDTKLEAKANKELAFDYYYETDTLIWDDDNYKRVGIHKIHVNSTTPWVAIILTRQWITGIIQLRIHTGNIYARQIDSAGNATEWDEFTKKSYVDEKIGDIETALDTIIAMQNELTGGGEV